MLKTMMKQTKPMRMSDYRRAQILRLDIISELYKRGYTYRAIREEVMARLDLDAYSLQTVHKDVQRLLAEWRATRIENVDLNMQLELQRLDDLIREAWAAWDKSKIDYEHERTRQTGVPGAGGSGQQGASVETVKIEKTRENVNACGDPRFLEMVHKLLIERRKILGLYSPEKKEVTGGIAISKEITMDEARGLIADLEANT